MMAKCYRTGTRLVISRMSRHLPVWASAALDFASPSNSMMKAPGAWKGSSNTLPEWVILSPNVEEHYDFDGTLDEKEEIQYVRDDLGNWTLRFAFIWDAASNRMVQVEQGARATEHY